MPTSSVAPSRFVAPPLADGLDPTLRSIASTPAPSARHVLPRQGRVAAVLCALLLALSACGGGKGDPCGLAATCGSPSVGGGAGSSGGTDSGGGTGATSATAADMTLELSAGALLDNGTDRITATVTTVDANRNLLPGAPVTFSVDNNAVAAVGGKLTGENGTLAARIGIGPDRANRVITVTATSGSLVRTASFQVTGARIQPTALPAVVAPGARGSVVFRLVDVNSNPITGRDITITGIGGIDSSGRTNSNGEYVYDYVAPAVGTTFDVRAQAAGVTVTQTVRLQSQSIPPAADGIESATLSVSPAVVPVNSGAVDSNQVEVRALFLRDTNKPVPNVRVRFLLGPNLNDIPGTLTSGSATVYSDANGIARTTYVPGDRTSPNDGVTIYACYGTTDAFDTSFATCRQARPATLTVVSEPVSVSIGTDNVIISDKTRIDYEKRFLVQVNDASGAPKADVLVTAVLDLPRYRTGYWFAQGVDWFQRVEHVCDNEDINRNVAIEQYANGVDEDANRDGRLNPRRANVLVSFEGSQRTDAKGQVVLRFTYPQSVASWAEYRLDVIASGTAGTEGRASIAGVLPVLDEHVRSPDRIRLPPAPAFIYSSDNPPGWQPPELRNIVVPPWVDPITSVFVLNPDEASGLVVNPDGPPGSLLCRVN